MVIATVFVVIVAALHVAFAAGESVGWTAFARRFGYSAEKIEHTRALALNQGAYNLGVAAMLGVAVATGNWGTVQVLLGFIIAMAIVGALSVRWTIFAIQGVPAIAALGLVMAGGPQPQTKTEPHTSAVQVDSGGHGALSSGAWTTRRLIS